MYVKNWKKPDHNIKLKKKKNTGYFTAGTYMALVIKI